MASLSSNITNRVQRLPKPASAAQAMQPLFEAVSNSIHAVQALFDDDADKHGAITVLIAPGSEDDHPFYAVIEDNGIGLDQENYDAFLTTDTDYKLKIGGKGVGRLLWLDCFEKILIESVYTDREQMRRRTFQFRLSQSEQIMDETDEEVSAEAFRQGTRIAFEGLRAGPYVEKFPKQIAVMFRHFMSHFLPTFVGGSSPSIIVEIGDEVREFPSGIWDYVLRQDHSKIDHDEYGVLSLTLMECSKAASAGLSGKHYLHLIAHNRTVLSQPLDGRLGLKTFGDDEQRVFHGCVAGTFFDDHVNQERTQFNFSAEIVDDVARTFCDEGARPFLSEFLDAFEASRVETMKEICDLYPSVAFDEPKALMKLVPKGETKPDSLFGALQVTRFRRDARHRERLASVVKRLRADRPGDADAPDFESELRIATEGIHDSERRSLSEYVVRRKVVLEFMTVLLQKIRADTQDSSYHLEESLHTFICPIRVKSDTTEIESLGHDLWIIDERLTFAKYFSSDVSFERILEESVTSDRPDLLIFDKVHGLRQSQDPSKVLVVEFKRPGRTNYNVDENPQFQVERYLEQLSSGNVRDINGRPVRLTNDTLFFCYIIADRLGRMKDWTRTWADTYGGRGKMMTFQSDFRGSIELIEWDTLLEDAWERNNAFFGEAGIGGPTTKA